VLIPAMKTVMKCVCKVLIYHPTKPYITNPSQACYKPNLIVP
jgi:hypothetical protein